MQAQANSADAANDMDEIGDIVSDKEDGVHLLPKIHERHQDQRNGNLSRFRAGERRQHDEHEHDPADSQKERMGKENELQEPGDQRGGGDTDGDRPASIQFLQRRSHYQEQQHVAEKVGHTGVSEDMPEKAFVKLNKK